MGATGVCIAAIRCALISIVAIDGLHIALAQHTLLVDGTEAVVRTILIVVNVNASKFVWITRVIGAGIPIIAIQRDTDAICRLTLITYRAGTAVVAGPSNCCVSAPCFGVALVKCTHISIITINQ